MVDRGCHHVAVRRSDDARRNKPGDVGHVRHQRPHLIGNLRNASKSKVRGYALAPQMINLGR